MLNISWISPTTTYIGSFLQVNQYLCYCLEEQGPMQISLKSRSASPGRICHHQHNRKQPHSKYATMMPSCFGICRETLLLKSSKQIMELILLICPRRWNKMSWGMSEEIREFWIPSWTTCAPWRHKIDCFIANWRRIRPLLDDECIAPDWSHDQSRRL